MVKAKNLEQKQEAIDLIVGTVIDKAQSNFIKFLRKGLDRLCGARISLFTAQHSTAQHSTAQRRITVFFFHALKPHIAFVMGNRWILSGQ